MTCRYPVTLALTALLGAAPLTAAPQRQNDPSITTRDIDAITERLYAQARTAIENGQFDAALNQLDSLIARFDGDLKSASGRADAALYWKAYSEARQHHVDDALKTVERLKESFKDSRWLKDALALAVEVQQSSGRTVSPNQPDDDLKLLALRGLMRSDPERALTLIEQTLAGNGSTRVKANALFVLSQSRTPKAQAIISTFAKNGADPELQLKAIRYLGSARSAENSRVLDEAFRNATDDRVKRAVVRSYTMAGDRARLSAIAADAAQSDAVRGDAIQQLGVLKADDELVAIYRRESSPRLKDRALDGLFTSRNAARLVELARTETNPELKREIVEKLSHMRAKEATDYMVELLK